MSQACRDTCRWTHPLPESAQPSAVVAPAIVKLAVTHHKSLKGKSEEGPETAQDPKLLEWAELS